MFTWHHKSLDPCHCRPWHRDCDPSTCSQAKFDSENVTSISLKTFRRSGEQGCPTCAIITSAFDIPEIRKIWQQSIEPALRAQRAGVISKMREDEEEILIELMLSDHGPDRRILRTRGSEVSNDWRHFNFWRENSNRQNERCGAFPALDYQPGERTDSPRTMEHLRNWIKFCNENHNCCSSDDPVLPTRVVDVTDNHVRVYEAQGRPGRYTTLSHRWGTSETFKLTRLNMALMTNSIPWESIPKLYQESIELTRLLGIEYIWIDSLCIIQDDADDWEREAGTMKAVYGNSYLNIAATHAIDSHIGLFKSSRLGADYPAQIIPRDPKIQIRPQPHLTHRHFGSNYVYYPPDCPLMERGWVLQERILSPRIVHYDGDEIKWECQAVADCQCGGLVVIANFKREFHGGLKPGGNPLPYQWMRISERYSGLKFTYSSDRLIALAGVAELGVQSGKGGKYLAGLWERSLAHQLCWKIIETHKRPDVYLAPSWSWISVFGTVRYSNRMDFSSRCSNIDVKITEVSCLSAEGAIPTPSTSPIMGFIRLEGRGLKMRAELIDPGTQSVPPIYSLKADGDGEGLSFRFQTDYVMARQEAGAITEVFLLFWGCMWPSEDVFLILKPMPAESCKFERIGIMHIPQGSEAKEVGQILGLCKKEGNIVIV
ncbi:heterokaryon incompatibility protein-domain-containing protein [Xylaria sp. FL1777]|nr:heterokaryon incompatibility protein-domain-containing protein [Xylaria sp. FL1777]